MLQAPYLLGITNRSSFVIAWRSYAHSPPFWERTTKDWDATENRVLELVLLSLVGMFLIGEKEHVSTSLPADARTDSLGAFVMTQNEAKKHKSGLYRLTPEQKIAVEKIWESRKYKTGRDALAAIHSLGLKWIRRGFMYTHFGKRD